MKSRLLAVIIFVLLLSSGSFGSTFKEHQSFTPRLSFEPNRGQTSAETRYVARAAEGRVFLDSAGFRVLLPDGDKDGPVLSVNISGANTATKIESESATGGVSNYYSGSDRRNWLENVPHFAQVRYREIYRGIDLLFHGSDGHLEYDFQVSPGASVADIGLELPGDQSASLEADGSLRILAQGRTVRLLAPRAFQEDRAGTPVDVQFRVIDPQHVAFEVGDYDHTRALLIDPVVQYTAVIWADNSTEVAAMAVDSSGDVYITGTTRATNYPNTSGSSYSTASDAMYITKLDPTGTTILYSTVLSAGGSKAIALDASGNAYVAGVANGPSFPTSSQTLGACGSQFCYAGFTTKFNSTGQIAYSTLLASGMVLPEAITVVGSQALVTGHAHDETLYTTNAYQPIYAGQLCTNCSSPFLVKLNSSGTAYQFATYLGNGGGASAITVDSAGNIYIAGIGQVPMANPLEQVGNVFISEFSPDGQMLLASTYFGTVENPSIHRLAGVVAGKDGSVYVAGGTDAGDFPFTLNAFRLPQVPARYESGSFSMFAVGFRPGLSGEKFSTYLGQGFANAIAIDSTDHVYVAGSFGPEPIPLKNAVVSDLSSGGFVLSLDSAGAFTQATQFGGHNALELPAALAVDGSGNIYIAGNGSMAGTSSGAVLDPVNVGTGAAYVAQAYTGYNSSLVGYSTWAAKISTSNQPQISLSYWLPYLVLRDAGSADLNISSITYNGTPVTAGNCGNTLAAGSSCILNVTGDPKLKLVINSNAQPATQTYIPDSSGYPANIPLYFYPDALYFAPQQTFTTSAAKTVKVWNVLTYPQGIQSFHVQGSVQQTNDCPSSLAPGAYCTMTVTVNPGSVSYGGTIGITLANGYTISYYVYLLSAPSSALLPSMSSANFGKVQTGKSSLVRTIAVTNAGSTAIDAPVGSISGNADFKVVGTTCNSQLVPQQTCGIAVQYTPTANETASAELDIVSGSNKATIQLAAFGAITSSVTVDQLGLDFYNVIIGNTGYTRTLTLTNTGTAATTVTGINFSLPAYSETDNCAPSIAPGGSCTITVTAAPQDIGSTSSTLTITFDNAVTQRITITMNALLPVSITQSSADFGAVTPVGVDSNPVNLTVVNNGTIAASYALAVTGDFKINSICANPLPAYMGCASLSVIFHPTRSGPQQGTLTLSVPGIAAQQVVTLTGDTSTPGITISPNSLTFYPTSAKLTSSPLTLTLANPETVALTVPAPVLSGANPDQFKVTDTCSTLQPGETCPVAVVFAPTKAGNLSATLTFQNGATPSTSIPIALSGQASPASGFMVLSPSAYFGYLNIGQTSTTKTVQVRNAGPVPLALPTLTLGGDNPGDFTVTPDASCASVPALTGTCNINVVFTPKAQGGRLAKITFDSQATDPQTIEITLSGYGQDFTIAGGTSSFSKSISDGSSMTLQFQVKPDTWFSSQVNLTCQAVGSSYGPCTINPSPLNLNSSDGPPTVTVTISKSATAKATQGNSGLKRLMLALAILPCSFLIFRKRGRSQFVTVALLLSAVWLVSCGGGSGSTTPPVIRTYNYTVTAAAVSGTATHSFNIQLTVTQ